MGKDTKMPDYVVLISTLGGLALFGLNGFVIGPLVAALFISTWGFTSPEEPHRANDCRRGRGPGARQAPWPLHQALTIFTSDDDGDADRRRLAVLV